MDQAGLEIAVHLLAQVVDVDVDEVRPGVEVRLPHLFGDLRAADDPPGVFGQIDQQPVLLGREPYGRIAAPYLLADRVDAQVGAAERLLRCRRGVLLPLEQGPDPRGQLAEVERFDQVVVGPGVEAIQFVVGRAQRREHQDRHAGMDPADLPAELEPVHAGQHDIRDDQLERLRPEEAQAHGPVVGHRHPVAVLLEPRFQQVGHPLFILHDQYRLHPSAV